MTFNEFKKIIGYIQKNHTCPNCQQKFNLDMVHILGSSTYEGILLIDCDSCGEHLYVTIFNIASVAVMAANSLENKPPRPRKFKNNPNYEPVSKNDILDMYNFLKNFQGDISKYL